MLGILQLGITRDYSCRFVHVCASLLQSALQVISEQRMFSCGLTHADGGQGIKHKRLFDQPRLTTYDTLTTYNETGREGGRDGGREGVCVY